jgi:ribokinase
MRALVYGAINPDLVHLVDRVPGLGDDVRSTSWRLAWGGKAANAAVALAGWGVETRLLGLVVGTDALGNAVFDLLERPHLDRRWLERDPAEPTRHCVILLTPDGDRTIVCAGYEGARWQAVPEAAWHGVDVVLLDGFGGAAAQEVVAQAAGRRIRTVWLDAPESAAGSVSLIVWSRREHDEAATAAIGMRRQAIVLTAGPAPIVAYWQGRRFEVKPPQVEASDTTGAGDVFAAACAFGIGEGWTPHRILDWAAAAGAVAAAIGRPSVPTRDEVDALLH